MIVLSQRLEIEAKFEELKKNYQKQNIEAAGLTGCIRPLKLCYRGIASLPYIPMFAVVELPIQRKQPIVVMGNHLATSVVNSTWHNENVWKTSYIKLVIVSVD